MIRRVMAVSVIWILLFSVLGYQEAPRALAAQNNGTLVTLIQPEQVLDTITYQGITVEAVYTNGPHSGSDPVYSCAAFVKKFYQQVYGIGVYNLHSTSSTPLIYDEKGSFSITEQPQIGDIVRDNNRTHWAIVKEVSEDTITLIQQNYRTTGTMAWTGCTVDRMDSGFTFFTYSGRVDDTSMPLAPRVMETEKTLYTGYQDYQIQLEQITDEATVYYNSDTPEVAVVSSDGIVTPVQEGEAIIYINVVQDNVIYSLQVVIKVKVPYLKLSASTKEVAVGKSLTIKVKQYGTEEAVAIQVSNNEIATINEVTRKLLARRKGTVIVTVSTSGGLTAKLKIKVI